MHLPKYFGHWIMKQLLFPYFIQISHYLPFFPLNISCLAEVKVTAL